MSMRCFPGGGKGTKSARRSAVRQPERRAMRCGFRQVGFQRVEMKTPAPGIPGAPASAFAAGKGDSAAQRARMVRDVLADEAGDEVVAVVIAGLHAQLQRVAGGFGCLAQQLWLQLAFEEFVSVTLVDQ